MMVVGKDEWLAAAMTDDMVVVELLLLLKQPLPMAATEMSKPCAVIPLRWGTRLPRSRPAAAAAAVRCDAGSFKRKEGDSSTRCSPTTPLSWSGGGGAASPSATGDGFDEETSRHVIRSSSVTRSKGASVAETASTTTKRSRKKKTFAELKEEENLLLKEKMHLKKELVNLRATYKEQRTRNENLKRMKLDLDMCSAKNSVLASHDPEKANFCQSNLREPSFLNHIPSTLLTHVRDENHPQSDSCESDNTVPNHDRFFLLPDLNMMPSEEGLWH